LVLAAAAGQARHLRLPKPLLARGASPEAAKPLSAANGVGRVCQCYPDMLLFSRQPKIDIMINIQRQVSIRTEMTLRTALILPI
jgi:hypothetical protein